MADIDGFGEQNLMSILNAKDWPKNDKYYCKIIKKIEKISAKNDTKWN